MISKFQQTIEENPTFKLYKCFYCGTSITSEVFLTNHVKTCHGKQDSKSQVAVFNRNLHEHKNSENSEWGKLIMTLSAMRSPKVKCDVCSKEFESDGMVQLHKMSEHDPKFAFLRVHH